jgi:dihydroorotate dehydrogenase subfamily 1
MRSGQEIIGWENIELISDRPFADWLDDFRRLHQKPRTGRLIASIMEEYSRDAWHEIVERTQATGVDALELNLSCPHGLPEQRMGSAIGQDPEMVAHVCAWVRERATIPVWAKLTPNVTDIRNAGRAALLAGCHGLCATNTILSVMGINLETLRPEPTVEGYSIAGGYSGRAIRPISLRMNMELAKMMETEKLSGALIGLGGVETGEDAAQYILIGANAIQICTGVMIRGYRMIRDLTSEMEAFMFRHNFVTVSAFRGRALPYFTTHADLVARQRPQVREDDPSIEVVVPVKDADWRPETFVAQSDALISR